MPSTISAGTTAGTAIAIAGDTTGNLAFQTNGTTTAMTITTSQQVGIGTTSPTTNNGNVSRLLGLAGDNNVVISSVNANSNFNLIFEAGKAGRAGSTRYAQIQLMNTSDNGSINFYTAPSGSDVTERMVIDSAGRVTAPFQPGCLVGKTNGNVAAQNIVVFDQIIYNVGSHYNNSNGRFTAPVAGYYYLSASALGTTSAGVEVSIRRNGGVVVNTRGGGASGYTSASSSVIIYANANDYFDYRTEGAYTVDGGSGYPYTGMCVYLIG